MRAHRLALWSLERWCGRYGLRARSTMHGAMRVAPLVNEKAAACTPLPHAAYPM